MTKSNPHCLKPISFRHLTLLIKPHIYQGVVKMQTIGSLLKAERLKLRLTQKQMAAGVISTSFYSKVENDINDINAKDLISILELNKVSVPKFMSQVSIQQKKSESMASIEQRLYSAFFSNNLRTVQKINDGLSQNPMVQDRQHYTDILGKIIQAILTDSLKDLDETTKTSSRDILFSQDNWNARTLALFANTIDLYEFDELSFLINALLHKYNRQNLLNDELLSTLSTIFINYIDTCYRKNEIAMMNRPLSYLNHLPLTPVFFFYRLLGKYYEALTSKSKEASKNAEINEIRSVLKLMKLDKLAGKLPI